MENKNCSGCQYLQRASQMEINDPGRVDVVWRCKICDAVVGDGVDGAESTTPAPKCPVQHGLKALILDQQKADCVGCGYLRRVTYHDGSASRLYVHYCCDKYDEIVGNDVNYPEDTRRCTECCATQDTHTPPINKQLSRWQKFKRWMDLQILEGRCAAMDHKIQTIGQKYHDVRDQLFRYELIQKMNRLEEKKDRLIRAYMQEYNIDLTHFRN